MGMFKKLTERLFKAPEPTKRTKAGSVKDNLKTLLKEEALNEIIAQRRLMAKGVFTSGSNINRRLRELRAEGFARVQYKELHNGARQAIYSKS